MPPKIGHYIGTVRPLGKTASAGIAADISLRRVSDGTLEGAFMVGAMSSAWPGGDFDQNTGKYTDGGELHFNQTNPQTGGEFEKVTVKFEGQYSEY